MNKLYSIYSEHNDQYMRPMVHQIAAIIGTFDTPANSVRIC